MSLAIWAMETMMAASQENWIKHRAYELWEQEGYPSGKDIEHWERAKLEYATLRPTAAETDVLRNGASAKTTKAAAKPANSSFAKAWDTGLPVTQCQIVFTSVTMIEKLDNGTPSFR